MLLATNFGLLTAWWPRCFTLASCPRQRRPKSSNASLAAIGRATRDFHSDFAAVSICHQFLQHNVRQLRAAPAPWQIPKQQRAAGEILRLIVALSLLLWCVFICAPFFQIFHVLHSFSFAAAVWQQQIRNKSVNKIKS